MINKAPQVPADQIPRTLDIPNHRVYYPGGVYLTLWPAELMGAGYNSYDYRVGAKVPDGDYYTLIFTLTSQQLREAMKGRNVWSGAFYQSFREYRRPVPYDPDLVRYELPEGLEDAMAPEMARRRRAQERRDRYTRIAVAPRGPRITVVSEGRAKGIPMTENGFVPVDALRERNSKRSNRSLSMDRRRRSKVVRELPITPLDAASWWNHPERSDIEGIDTPDEREDATSRSVRGGAFGSIGSRGSRKARRNHTRR